MTNMLLDFLFVGVWGFGLAGAAIATVCGELIGGLFPVIYFFPERIPACFILGKHTGMGEFFCRLVLTVLLNL